jgi:hypothetical protein
MSPVKEPHFLASDIIKGGCFECVKTIEEYLKLFSDVEQETVIGEASSEYLYSIKAVEEIYSLNPDSKILVSLRNPIQMMHSLHSLQVFANVEPEKDFEKALKLEKQRIADKYVHKRSMDVRLYYLDSIKRIPVNLRRYIEVFGRDNVKIIIFDEFIDNTERIYKDVLDFLNIDTRFKPAFKKYNSDRRAKIDFITTFLQGGGGDALKVVRNWFYKKPLGIVPAIIESMNAKNIERPAMNIETEKMLSKKLAPVINDIAEIAGKDLSKWTEG